MESWEYVNRDMNAGRQIDFEIYTWFQDRGFNDIMPRGSGNYATINALSSAATILMGVVIGRLLISSYSSFKKVLGLLLAGGVFFGLGLVLANGGGMVNLGLPWEFKGVPIVKRIWTASFALYAAGWTCWMMLLFYLIIDVIGLRGLAWPFVAVGVNSIFMYMAAEILNHDGDPSKWVNNTIDNILKPFAFEPLKELGPRHGGACRPRPVPALAAVARCSTGIGSVSRCKLWKNLSPQPPLRSGELPSEPERQRGIPLVPRWRSGSDGNAPPRWISSPPRFGEGPGVGFFTPRPGAWDGLPIRPTNA